MYVGCRMSLRFLWIVKCCSALQNPASWRIFVLPLTNLKHCTKHKLSVVYMSLVLPVLVQTLGLCSVVIPVFLGTYICGIWIKALAQPNSWLARLGPKLHFHNLIALLLGSS